MTKRKKKIRFPALGGLLATLGSVAGVVALDPHIIASAAGKLGVSTAILSAVVQAVLKPITRDEHER